MNNRNIPDLMLEQYLLNELNEPDRVMIEEQLRQNVQLQDRIKSIRQSDKLFAIEHSNDCFTKKLKSEKPFRFDFTTFLKPVIVPVLCSIILIPVVFVLFFKSQSVGISERTKGKIISLIAYRKTDLGHEQLQNGAVVRQADLIQLEYLVSDSLLFGMIISIDGACNSSILFGTEEGKSVGLSSRHKKLPFAYELDNAPDFEKFFLITSTKPFYLNDCITLCKNMDKNQIISKRFIIRMLSFNKVVLTKGS